ncbi:MAG: peptidase dimerization domain-containing protein [Chitinophagaceae bacterium]
MIDTAEKGFLSLQLEVQKDGGHSSMPEKETAIDILSNGLAKLRGAAFKGRLAPAQQDFVRYIGPELPFIKRMAFANTWLFENVIIKEYEKTSTGNALMRATLVPTILRAGIKDNIVPSAATAIINIRLFSGDSAGLVAEKVKNIINDLRVKVSMVDKFEASATTPVNSDAFKRVEISARKTFPNTIIAPFLLIAGTDSHHFQQLAKHIIRFTPAIDPQNFHGVNERVSLRSYQLSLWFYEQLLRSEI